MRGKVRIDRVTVDRDGITPAYAGKSHAPEHQQVAQ